MRFRTDLAMEALPEQGEKLPEGVRVREKRRGRAVFTRVEITGEAGERALGKPRGTYVTAELPPFSSGEAGGEEEALAIGEALRELLPRSGLVLTVGLGNENCTPDALGPRTADLVLATRHLTSGERGGLFEGFRPAAALAPGVLGQTGVETGELISALVRELRPAAVIAVDALAGRSLDRLGRTLQLTDTGIVPGSGIQNARQELSSGTLGVPVIGMGVPTVVDAVTLACDLLRRPEEDLGDLRKLFRAEGGSLMVTPGDVDLMVERAARLTALSINLALQPRLTPRELQALMA